MNNTREPNLEEVALKHGEHSGAYREYQVLNEFRDHPFKSGFRQVKRRIRRKWLDFLDDHILPEI